MNTKPDLAAVFQHYGIEPSTRPGWAKVKCPLHDDTHASATINLDEQIWHCFTCDISGDAYTLIMKKEGVDFPHAVKLGETYTHGSSPTLLEQSERGLLGIPTRQGNTRKRTGYTPPSQRFRGVLGQG